MAAGEISSCTYCWVRSSSEWVLVLYLHLLVPVAAPSLVFGYLSWELNRARARKMVVLVALTPQHVVSTATAVGLAGDGQWLSWTSVWFLRCFKGQKYNGAGVYNRYTGLFFAYVRYTSRVNQWRASYTEGNKKLWCLTQIGFIPPPHGLKDLRSKILKKGRGECLAAADISSCFPVGIPVGAHGVDHAGLGAAWMCLASFTEWNEIYWFIEWSTTRYWFTKWHISFKLQQSLVHY